MQAYQDIKSTHIDNARTHLRFYSILHSNAHLLIRFRQCTGTDAQLSFPIYSNDVLIEASESSSVGQESGSNKVGKQSLYLYLLCTKAVP